MLASFMDAGAGGPVSPRVDRRISGITTEVQPGCLLAAKCRSNPISIGRNDSALVDNFLQSLTKCSFDSDY